jgi:hypothetical protein
MCDALLLMCNWSTLARKNGQLLLMHRPTIAHAPTNYCSCTDRAIIGRLPSNYLSVTDQLLLTHRQLLLTHRPTIAHALTEQLLVGYRAIIGWLPTNYWSHHGQYIIPHHVITTIGHTYDLWPSTGRIIFWVWSIGRLHDSFEFHSLGSWLYFRPHKVNFFVLCIKFYIKSSPKSIKMVKILRGSEKDPKIRMVATRRNLFLRSKK